MKNRTFHEIGIKYADLWLFEPFFAIYRYLEAHFLGFVNISLRVSGSRKTMPLSVFLYRLSLKSWKISNHLKETGPKLESEFSIPACISLGKKVQNKSGSFILQGLGLILLENFWIDSDARSTAILEKRNK